jgi:hypothetical protein
MMGENGQEGNMKVLVYLTERTRISEKVVRKGGQVE